MRINGIGATLLGISKPDEYGESTATRWFTFAFLPIFPIRRIRVKFLPHKGSGFSYQRVRREKLVLAEVLKTYLFGWVLIPVFAAGPSFLGFSGIWTALALPMSFQIPYLVVSIVWAGIVIWKTADRHEERCRPSK
jgi:hypothetical protein